MQSINGIFTGYVSGSAGNSLIILVMIDGVIAGTDVLGMKIDGSYQIDASGQKIHGIAHYKIPANTMVLTGEMSGPEGAQVDLPLDLPIDFTEAPYHTIQTPLGVVNVRFEKLRDLPPGTK